MTNDKKYIKSLLPKRPQSSHKGTFGHVLNIAGCGFYSGAAYFSSISPLRVGAGRVTLASVQSVLQSVAALSPDVILLPLTKSKNNTISEKSINILKKRIQEFQAVSVGCGLSTDMDTANFFKKFIELVSNQQIPLLIDADGLNILSKYKFKMHSKVVLTPHPQEMARLMGVKVENIVENQEFWAKQCAEKYKCVVVLKTHESVVADFKGHLYINKTGNSALAKGGSGDVLAGMITGFAAQGINVFDSCVLAVYLHGLAGELASIDLSEHSVLASELLNYIPNAIKVLMAD